MCDKMRVVAVEATGKIPFIFTNKKLSVFINLIKVAFFDRLD